MMPAPSDLTQMTPAEVDILLAPLEGALFRLREKRWALLDSARTQDGHAGSARNPKWAAHYAADAIRYREQADAVLPEIEAADAACEPYRAEYVRRGGWPRIFWCTANGGHAHRSLSCSTLRPTTGMVWLPELSGTDEAALVELAGDSACTVCYPSAPVNRPSQLRPAVEAREAKAARDAELAAKRAAKDAKSITMPDGSPLKVGWTEARTVVSAWREGSGALASLLWYSAGHPSAPEWRRFAELAAEALAAKLGRTPEDVMAELESKAQAKHKRDSR